MFYTTYLLFSVTEDLIPEECQMINTCVCCKSVYPKWHTHKTQDISMYTYDFRNRILARVGQYTRSRQSLADNWVRSRPGGWASAGTAARQLAEHVVAGGTLDTQGGSFVTPPTDPTMSYPAWRPPIKKHALSMKKHIHVYINQIVATLAISAFWFDIRRCLLWGLCMAS